MANSQNQDLELWANDDAEIDIIVYGDDGETPLPLGDVSLISWSMADAYDFSRVLIRKDTGSGGGIEITDETAGALKVVLEAADTIGLGGQPYFHELVITDTGGTKLTVLSGQALVHKTIPSASS